MAPRRPGVGRQPQDTDQAGRDRPVGATQDPHEGLARGVTATLAASGLAPHQFRVLLHLGERPGTSQADLARRPGDPAVGRRAGAHDGGGGLLERTPPAGRGRPSALWASAAGRAVLVDEVTPTVPGAPSAEELVLDEAGHEWLDADLHTVLRAMGG